MNENIAEELQRIAASEFGRKGGETTRDKYGSEHYRRMQAKGVKTKLQKKRERSKTPQN
jgi:hypothetical protein